MTAAPQVEPVSKKRVLEKAEAQEHRCRLRLPPKAPLSFVLGSASKRKPNSGGSEAAAQQTPEPKTGSWILETRPAFQEQRLS